MLALHMFIYWDSIFSTYPRKMFTLVHQEMSILGICVPMNNLLCLYDKFNNLQSS